MSITNPTNITTEWDDLQRRFGNLPPQPKVVKEQQFSDDLVDAMEQVDILGNLKRSQLDELEESGKVDEHLIEMHRKKRLEEMKYRHIIDRFGEVIHLGKEDFVREVTEASKECVGMSEDDGDQSDSSDDNGSDSELKRGSKSHVSYSHPSKTSSGKKIKMLRGTWVLVHLYKDAVETCVLMNRVFDTLCSKYKSVKFTRAIADDVIPYYPDSKLPTILFYKAGACQQQVIGAKTWGGDTLTASSVEAVLTKTLKLFDAIKNVEESDEEDSEGDKSDNEKGTVRSRGYASTLLDSMISRRL